jgi:hypothetical protein
MDMFLNILLYEYKCRNFVHTGIIVDVFVLNLLHLLVIVEGGCLLGCSTMQTGMS